MTEHDLGIIERSYDSKGSHPINTNNIGYAWLSTNGTRSEWFGTLTDAIADAPDGAYLIEKQVRQTYRGTAWKGELK